MGDLLHNKAPFFMMDRMKFLMWMALFLSMSNLHAQTPDLILRGTLKGADHQTYVQVPFEVPAKTQRITVAFDYSGKQDRSVIDLGLIGPDGRVLGWSGGNKSSFTISAVDATPSYSPSPIHPGRWKLLLGVPNLRVGATADYQAQVYFSSTMAAACAMAGMACSAPKPTVPVAARR